MVTTLADRYELLEQVGEGGMGVVWRAYDRKLERDVAIKLLHAFVASEPEQRRRFNREARTLAGLANDHIVRVYDYVDDGEQAFLVMEYVAGGSLAEATFDRLPLPAAEAAWYTKPVAEALAYAHPRGVIHRDLTPANILIERETGRVVTTDYGLARIARSAGSLTATGVLIGTPEYWSPEQAMGRDNDGAADMYALGCILFLLLSGRLPFDGDDRLAIGLRRAHEDAPSLRVVQPTAPHEAVTLVDSLLNRAPAGRPDAAEASAALSKLAPRTVPMWELARLGERSLEPATIAVPKEPPTLANATVALAARPAPPPPPPAAPASRPHAPRRRRRRRALAALAAAALAAIAGVVAFDELRGPVARAPNVVAMRESVARARLLHALPSASVLAVRVYSTRVATGRVIRQHPLPRSKLSDGAQVTLTVSKGSPYAEVPSIAAGTPAAAVRTSLARHGFHGRYRFTPSWTIRKGSVIELSPGSGTRLRRPATVKIVVASGYPRAVVPDVQNVDLRGAESQLATKHLRFYVVYRLTKSVAAGQVVGQIPAAGATVYSGTRVRLTVTRSHRWEKVFAYSGTDGYESDPFTVPTRWRIRYRLKAADSFTPALAQFAWSRDGSIFGEGNSFFANSANALRVYTVHDGAGTYRLGVSPYAGTAWYVEVDALK